MPDVIDTLDVFGPKTLAFGRELGRRICQETGEKMATSHLMLQCLSVVIQRRKAAAVLGLCIYLNTHY